LPLLRCCPLLLHAHTPVPAQPCLENKSLGRKQTLTYLKGYPQQDPDVSGLMSYDGRARPAQSPKIGASYSASGGSSSGAATGEADYAVGSPHAACSSPLPKWVEQDRQVCWPAAVAAFPAVRYPGVLQPF
jgi:hypothetical protein